MPIHPTAIVDPAAEIDPSVEIGPYCIIERDVRIGAGTQLIAHAYVCRWSRLGERVRVHPYCVIGDVPQDFAFKGEPSYCEIGDETILREHVTVHRGTMPGSSTVIGKRCLLMALSHAAHNCHVADDAKIGNNTVMGGHAQIGPHAFVSGNVGLHQFTRIGERAIVAGGIRSTTDVPPFMMYAPRGVVGPNSIGLRRAGFSPEERLEIRTAYKLLFRSGLLFRDAIERVAELVKTDPGRRLLEFLRAPAKRPMSAYRQSGIEEAPEDSGDNEA